MDPDYRVTIARAAALEALAHSFWVYLQRLQVQLRQERSESVEPTELW